MAITATQRATLFGEPGQVDRVTYVTPWGVKVSIHPQILARFRAACEKAARTVKWTPQRIDSYNPRQIRGSTAWSLHAWAMAFDFFATGPNVVPPGGVWTPDDEMPAEFVRCFTELGFRWGGTFARKDTPHIEWADGLPEPLTAPAPPQQEDDMTADDRAQLDNVRADVTTAIREVRDLRTDLTSAHIKLDQAMARLDAILARVG